MANDKPPPSSPIPDSSSGTLSYSGSEPEIVHRPLTQESPQVPASKKEPKTVLRPLAPTPLLVSGGRRLRDETDYFSQSEYDEANQDEYLAADEGLMGPESGECDAISSDNSGNPVSSSSPNRNKGEKKANLATLFGKSPVKKKGGPAGKNSAPVETVLERLKRQEEEAEKAMSEEDEAAAPMSSSQQSWESLKREDGDTPASPSQQSWHRVEGEEE